MSHAEAENSAEFATKLDYGDPLSLQDLLKIDIFQKAPKPLLEKNLGAVVLRRFRKGEVLCREGDQGSTAFYILKGSVRISIQASFGHVESKPNVKSRFGIQGLISKMTSFFAKREKNPASGPSPALIPIDAPVDLPYDRPVAVLKEGSLFGEMTCLSYYPRSATVVADEDCEALEMLQNILHICRRDPEFKKKLDATYRERSLVTHLRSIPLFEGLDEATLNRLRDATELVSYEPGTAIFSEGDAADALYLVRIGFVKVSKMFPGGPMVLNYLPRGASFGEMGILKRSSSGVRTATCTALDHVEIVKIKVEDLNEILDRFPDVAKKLEALAESREHANRHALKIPQGVPLDDFLDQGLMQAQNLLVLDLEKCTRCDACTEACAATHDGVTRLIREGLRYENFLVATSCRQCMDPLCMVGCPVGSIRRKDSLEIIIEDWCIGCGLCAKNCPYGNINMHSIEATNGESRHGGKAVLKKKAVTCDLCTEEKEPACVYACPHDAAHRIDDPREFFKLNVDR